MNFKNLNKTELTPPVCSSISKPGSNRMGTEPSFHWINFRYIKSHILERTSDFHTKNGVLYLLIFRVKVKQIPTPTPTFANSSLAVPESTHFFFYPHLGLFNLSNSWNLDSRWNMAKKCSSKSEILWIFFSFNCTRKAFSIIFCSDQIIVGDENLSHVWN